MFQSVLGKIQRRGEKRTDVLFYAVSWIDEAWVRSTIDACRLRGLSVTLAVAGVVPEVESERYRALGVSVRGGATAQSLKRTCASVAVTASSGVPRALFGKNVADFIHMPHSMVSLHMVYPEGSFDGYDTLFAAGPHHVAEFAAMSRRLGRERPSLPVGYGKADLLAAESTNGSERSRVLLAPSWGPQSLLPTVGKDLVATLLAAQWQVTLRPHPLHVLERDVAFESIRSIFQSNCNFRVELPSSPPQSMSDADVMITDYSGTAFEYVLLRERPVIFVDVPRKIVNSNWQALGLPPVEVELRHRIGVVAEPDAARITAIAAQIQEDVDGWRARIADAVPMFSFRRSGVGEAAANAIGTIIDELRT